MRIELADGNWAELRDPKSFRHRDRKALLLALDSASDESDMARGIIMQDKLLALLIESWSFSMPAPTVDASSLDDLPIPDYDLLVTACEEVRTVMFPDFSPDPQDGSPTSPSTK